MAQDRGLWLIGVPKDELDAAGRARFISRLLQYYHGRTMKPDQGTPSNVREVPAPVDVYALQQQHGKEYVQFYYVNEALTKAAKDAGIGLHRLQLVFGPPPGAEVFSVIALPTKYDD